MDKDLEMYTMEKIFSSGDGITSNYVCRIACTTRKDEGNLWNNCGIYNCN